MNKTVTINISGIIFHIEEEAFDVLQKYINAIKSSFKHTEGGNEIMADIEARIAELLQSHISPSKQVVIMDDVNMVMETMGRPEQIASSDETGERQSSNTENPSYERIKRRLFRDPEERAVGGVCSGLAAYFNIDVVWVRLATFLLIFFGGLSLWVYIILWIVIPEARTTADKFAMRGEPANINTIFRSFQEEADDVKNRMHKYGQEFKDKGYASSVRSNINSFLHSAFSILGRLIGLLLVFIGGTLLIAYAASLMGISIADGDADFEKWRHTIFTSSNDYALAVFAFAVVVGIPVIMLVYSGIKLLFRLRYRNRWLNVALGILWTIGFVTGLYIAINTFQQFKETSRVKEAVKINSTGDTLLVKLNPDYTFWREMNFDNEDALDHYLAKDRTGYLFGERNGRLSITGTGGLNILYTEADSASLVLVRSARGENKRIANLQAKSIQYRFRQDGNVITFDRFFMVEEDAPFRMQDLNLQLMLPVGTVVKLDRSVQYFLDDVENTSNTWDGDMAGRRWIMTDRGLKCIDCDNLDRDEEDQTATNNRHEKVTINGDGIHVKTETEEVRIDGNGIRIETPAEDRRKKGKKSKKQVN